MPEDKYAFLNWLHVEVDYNTRHTAKCQSFVPSCQFHVVPLMDNSKAGMCFWYYFEDSKVASEFEQHLKKGS